MRSILPALSRIGVLTALVLPLTLTHLRGLAEADLDILAVIFLLRSGITGATNDGWGWVREPWVLATFAWWGWQMLCTAMVSPGHGALVQAAVAIRFPLAAAALGCWILRDATTRRRVVWITCACGLYIAAQIIVQAVFGHNLFGNPRFPDGVLTGPYKTPRAAAPLSRLLLPTLMLGCAFIAARCKSRIARLVGMSGVTVAVVAITILAGQRMPFALCMFGIAICALLYRPMRPAALVGACAIPLLVLAVRVLSPGSFSHLVTRAQEQLAHFSQSPYGQIYTHAVVMAQGHPLLGQGYDAYRHHCADPTTFHGLSWLSPGIPDGGWQSLCVQHPHNHYLQALTNAGVPGLILFCMMIICWLIALWPRKGAPAVAIGLFAAVLIQEWPIASSSDFLNLPLGGWGFLLLGLGLSFRGVSEKHGFQAG